MHLPLHLTHLGHFDSSSAFTIVYTCCYSIILRRSGNLHSVRHSSSNLLSCAGIPERLNKPFMLQKRYTSLFTPKRRTPWLMSRLPVALVVTSNSLNRQDKATEKRVSELVNKWLLTRCDSVVKTYQPILDMKRAVIDGSQLYWYTNLLSASRLCLCTIFFANLLTSLVRQK